MRKGSSSIKKPFSIPSIQPRSKLLKISNEKKKKIKEFIDEWIINNRFPYMTTAQVIKEGERREEENGNAKCRPD